MIDNNPCDPIVIIEDNEEIEDVESDVISDVQMNEVLQNEVHMNKYGVEEIIKLKDVTKKRSSQDKMTDKFINSDVEFLSSFIKYASVSWKGNCFLNFGKKSNIFGEYSDDFINFNSWKKSYIDVDLKKDYSNSDDVIRIIDNNYSSFMFDQEIRNSVQMCFKNHVSYKILKNINVSFWKNVYMV